jgi:hypothetical protein
MTTTTETVRALNDGLRKDFSTGRAVMTTGIAALGAKKFHHQCRDADIGLGGASRKG